MSDKKATRSRIDEERERDRNLVAQAIEAADAKELATLYERSEERMNNVIEAFNTIVEHYAGSSKIPRIHTADSVLAMRDVALAAIALAADIVHTPLRSEP